MVSEAYVLGLVFIVLVCFIWSGSSLLTQYLYNSDYSFRSPFLLTYIGVSLFSLWLPAWFAIHIKESGILDPEGIEAIPTPSPPLPASNGRSPRNQHPPQHSEEHGGDNEDEDEEDVDVVLELNVASRYHRSSPSPSVRADDVAAPTTITRPSSRILSHPRKWTHSDHFYAALRIAPVWFVANWAYNASLAYTSITSSTVLASTGSVFTFLFAVLTHDESFNWIKLIGVLLGVSGSIVTALTDVNGSSSEDDGGGGGAVIEPCDNTVEYCYEQPWIGDVLGLASAVGYGAYAVQARLYCPHDESLYSMQLLLGYIGLICMVVLSPFALWQFHTAHLSHVVVLFLLVKGLFDNALSDYLWLRAVILTSATVATVGMGLTIPLAFLSDLWQGAEDVITMGSVTGALLVLSGFVVVNAATEDEHAVPEETEHELTNLSNDSLRPLNSWEDEEHELGESDGYPTYASQGHRVV